MLTIEALQGYEVAERYDAAEFRIVFGRHDRHLVPAFIDECRQLPNVDNIEWRRIQRKGNSLEAIRLTNDVVAPLQTLREHLIAFAYNILDNPRRVRVLQATDWQNESLEQVGPWW